MPRVPGNGAAAAAASQGIVVRTARIGDIPSLCGLLYDLFSRESDFEPDRGKQARGLELLINDRSGSSLVLVAEVAGQVAGMCSVQTLVSTAEGGKAGLVEDVVVREDVRGLGIGTALLTRALSWCAEKGLDRVQLLADQKNGPALRFYGRRGWSTTDLVCLRTRSPRP